MSLRFKFNLLFAGCFAVFWGCSTLYFSMQAERLIDEIASHEARVQMQASLAVREYTQSHVKPYFDANPALGFHSISVPAFASREVLELIYKRFPGYGYREVALSPTNAKNLPDAWEHDQIQRFREPGAVTGQVVLVRSVGDDMLHAVLPVRIEKQACLQCHGQLQDAPEAMRTRYPGPNGYGWKLGEVIGAQIVTIPKSLHRDRFAGQRRDFALSLLGIFGLLFVVSNLLLHRLMVQPLARHNRTLRDLADTDGLTQVPNRRAFDDHLANALQDARDSGAALSVLMLDIDHFKQVNDSFGHASGDGVLRALGRELPRQLRTSDLFARLGGEEFGVVLAGVLRADAHRLAEALRTRCAKLDVGIGRPVTISVGVAQWDGTESAARLMQRCDAALYDAKASGRNLVRDAP
jgi:two-component system, cell cycle response regulator